MIDYSIDAGKAEALLVVSRTFLDRRASQILWAARDIRTITFPSTIRIVQDGAFRRTPLISAVLNEGLEELGECRNDADGVFRWTRLKRVVFPSTLRVIGNRAFY